MVRADLIAIACCVLGAVLVGGFGLHVWTIGLPTGLLLVLLIDGVSRPQSSVLVPTLWHGPRNRPKIALTFDDGPDPELTPRVIQVLSTAGVRATFFCIGQKLDACPQVADQLLAAGHELGNHSYEHSPLLNFAGPIAMGAEIERGAHAVRAAGGPPTPLYRPPIGLKNPPLSRVAHRLGLRVVTWSLHSRDTRLTDAGRVAKRVLERVRGGDIVLFHDNRAVCVDALPAILDGLAAQGLECVTVSELLELSYAPKG